MTEEQEESIGNRIRSARGYRGMGQAELARRIGLSKTSLSLIETGQTENPRSLVIRDIARVLRVNSNFLLGLSDKIEGDLEAAVAQLVGA
jgi:transcriptional regulator with XRE-family HTH domain